jgi:hypothetical protein
MFTTASFTNTRKRSRRSALIFPPPTSKLSSRHSLRVNGSVVTIQRPLPSRKPLTLFVSLPFIAFLTQESQIYTTNQRIVETRVNLPTVAGIKWLFFSTQWTEDTEILSFSSECAQFPIAESFIPSYNDVDDHMPRGTFDLTIDDVGTCQYKNDGTGNPGALWCGGGATLHTCHEHPHADRNVAESECKNLEDGKGSFVFHRQVLRCEWQ